MKKGLCMAAFTALVMGTASAALIEIDVSAAANGVTGTASEGTITSTSSVVDNTAGPGTMSYEITGLDLDEDGLATDSAVITFTVTGSATLQTATAGWLSAGAGLLNEDGDWLTIAFSGIDVYLDGSDTADAVASAASTLDSLSVKTAGMAVDDVSTINNVDYTATKANQVYDLGTDQSIEMAYTSTSSGDWRFGSMDYSVSIIPEPATIGLLGLGGMVAFFARKKNRG